MRWLNAITDSMDMNLSKLREIVKAGKPNVLQFMGLQRVGHNLVTKHTHIDKTENRLVDTVGEGEGGTN